MFYIVSYDITDDSMRVRICKLLKDYGTRVQYSVFECYLEPAQLTELLRKAAPLLNGPEDSLRVYNLCNNCCATTLTLARPHHSQRRSMDGTALQTRKGTQKPPAFIVL